MTNSDCTFKTEEIPVENFLSLSGVLKDYLNHNEKLKPFISSYCTIDELTKNIEDRKHFDFREELVSVLKEQNKNFDLKGKQYKNIDYLSNNNSFCITTAHQTNLLGGPLYFIQKAMSAIAVCKEAKKNYPNYEFIPIYWLGSEDHDFEELNHTTIFDKTYTWQNEQGGAVGRYSTSSLKDLIQEIKSVFSNSINDKYLKVVLEKYSQFETIADATRYLLNELLGKYGLLVIDGDDEVLKRKMIPIFKKELNDQFSKKASEHSINFLEEEYGSTQAHPRDINLFYLSENSRERITIKDDGFALVDSERFFTKNELFKELENYPTRFSPNVILRPLMQELCLPNLMYVGGGGEMSYWFQLKPIFDAVECPFPMLGLRDTAVYLSKLIQHKLTKLNLSVEDLTKDKDLILKELIFERTTAPLQLNKAKELVAQATELLLENANIVDETLNFSAKSSEQKMLNELERFEKKLYRAEKRKHLIITEQLTDVYKEVYPKNNLQERVINFSEIYSNYGQDWLNWQLCSFNLFRKTVKICLLE